MTRTHADARRALDAFEIRGAHIMVPIHFDTFISSDDAPGPCPEKLRRLSNARGFGDDRVAILRSGEQRVIVPR